MPLYMHIGLEDEFVGAGTYFFEDNRLAAWRKLVAADKTGKPLAALVAKLRKAGYCGRRPRRLQEGPQARSTPSTRAPNSSR